MIETDEAALARVFFEARTRRRWSSRPVTPDLIRRLYDAVKLGPTSMNSSPGRFLFLIDQDARARLSDHADTPNRESIMSAPCVATIAHDSEFFENMPRLLPHRPEIRDVFAGNPSLASTTAFRNGTLQGAYVIIAARMLGLDCGPMSGFDADGVDREFFSRGTIRSNFICAIGYATDVPRPRLPRLAFEEAAEII